VEGLPFGEPARIERFVLEEADGSPAGTAVWRKSRGQRGLQLERELAFLDPEAPGRTAGVRHVECLEAGSERAVFREIGAGGRVVLAEWVRPAGAPPGSHLRTQEWSASGLREELLSGAESAVLPLALCELARDGRLASGRLGCFDPLTRAIETLEVRTWLPREPAGGVERRVELRRLDGTLFLRLEFAGSQLEGFQLQEGGPRARRVEEQAYERAREAQRGGEAAPGAPPGGMR
jgi:hypothetical protein